MSFKFSVPTADPTDSGSHVMRAKQAKAWLDTLVDQPLMDSARGMYTAIYGSNRVRLDEVLYPLMLIGLALAIFGGLNAAHASGFLGVYVAVLVAVALVMLRARDVN